MNAPDLLERNVLLLGRITDLSKLVRAIAPRIEVLRAPDGLLVHGRLTGDATHTLVSVLYPAGPLELGWRDRIWELAPERHWRKVPAQWGGWSLYPAEGGAPGSFPARLMSTRYVEPDPAPQSVHNDPAWTAHAGGECWAEPGSCRYCLADQVPDAADSETGK